MKWDKIFSFSLIIVCISFFWTLTKYENLIKRVEKQRKEIIEINKNLVKLKKQNDSLDDRIFEYELKLFKYERAYKIYMDENPQAASHFSDIILDETE